MDLKAKFVELIEKSLIAYVGKSCKLAENIAGDMIANGVTVQEWISVKDRLPDIDGKYLVARSEGGRYSISVRKFRKEVPCWYTGYCGHWERRTNGITHWRYLPQPPKGE